MPAKSIEFLIDTDVIEDHLVCNCSKNNSYLESLMLKGICFSTVMNASELLYKSNSITEQKIIIDVLSALKILGLHARYSLLVPKYSNFVKNINEALICVVADYNKLPIVTLNKSKYSKCGLTIYHPSEIY